MIRTAIVLTLLTTAFISQPAQAGDGGDAFKDFVHVHAPCDTPCDTCGCPPPEEAEVEAEPPPCEERFSHCGEEPPPRYVQRYRYIPMWRYTPEPRILDHSGPGYHQGRYRERFFRRHVRREPWYFRRGAIYRQGYGYRDRGWRERRFNRRHWRPEHPRVRRGGNPYGWARQRNPYGWAAKRPKWWNGGAQYRQRSAARRRAMRHRKRW